MDRTYLATWVTLHQFPSHKDYFFSRSLLVRDTYITEETKHKFLKLVQDNNLLRGYKNSVTTTRESLKQHHLLLSACVMVHSQAKRKWDKVNYLI